MSTQERPQYVASLSYGKDSIAMLHVITDVLHWSLDRIVTADVWATDTIPAELPPMVEFKDKADRIIKERWGIEVEHFRAKESYEGEFYRKFRRGSKKGRIYGFPMHSGTWCNSDLKMAALNAAKKSATNSISYIGIAIDEPNRFHNLDSANLSPLVEAGWTEQMCRDWCEENGLLSPIYKDISRGGCWFCHNQSIEQLRLLRKNHPDLWQLLLKWDADSPTTFKADGHTVHDFERRFKWEDDGYLPMQKQFRWEDVENPQTNIFQFIGDGKDGTT